MQGGILMHFKKKLWYFLSILSTLLLVVLPISGCNSSFNVESTTETRTYTSTITNNSDKNTSDTSQSDNSSTASSKKKQIARQGSQAITNKIQGGIINEN